jgi:hypothetical protein
MNAASLTRRPAAALAGAAGPRPLSATSTLCPDRRCNGSLFDTTSRLAAALSVKTVRCDACGAAYAFRIPAAPVSPARNRYARR